MEILHFVQDDSMRFRMTERRFSIVPYPHVAEKIESGELLVKRLLQQIHFALGAVEVEFEFSAVVEEE